MSVIWKYQLPLEPVFTLAVPLGATALHVAIQDGVPCLWAQVDPAAETTPRTLHMSGTGDLIPDGLIHLGTVQMNGYVWHYFEERPA